MTLDDVDDIVDLLCVVSDNPTMADDFRHDALEQARGEVPVSTTYAICSDDQVVGRLRVVRTARYIEIAGLQVHPAWQSRGIGASMITTILDEGGRARLPVELDVDHENTGAQRLYARLGFERVGSTGSDVRMRCRTTTER